MMLHKALLNSLIATLFILAAFVAVNAKATVVDAELGLPKSPAVILTDIVVDPGTEKERVIEAPWFALTYSLSNKKEDEVLVLLDFDFRVRSTSGTKEYKVDPRDFDRAVMAIVLPGETYFEEETLYFGQLGLNEGSTRYEVRLVANGWWEEDKRPKSPFKLKANFLTQ